MNFTHSLPCPIPQSHLNLLTQIKGGGAKKKYRETHQKALVTVQSTHMCECVSETDRDREGEMKRVMGGERERVNEAQP